MSLLGEDWLSRAAALQRKGRAGRVRAGVCWGMYTRHRFEHRLRRYQVSLNINAVPKLESSVTCHDVMARQLCFMFRLLMGKTALSNMAHD